VKSRLQKNSKEKCDLSGPLRPVETIKVRKKGENPGDAMVRLFLRDWDQRSKSEQKQEENDRLYEKTKNVYGKQATSERVVLAEDSPDSIDCTPL